MKHLSIGIIFAALLATVVVGCRQGDKGEPGPSGSSGNLPYKSGSITGTLTGVTYQTDEDFTENLNFQYYKGPSDNKHTIINDEVTQEKYVITRYDSVGSSYIKFEFNVDYFTDQSGVEKPYFYDTYVTIVSNKKSASNKVFYFATTTNQSDPFDVRSVYLSNQSSGGNSNITIDNLSINENTGAVSFDYSLELNYYYNSSRNYAYLDGSVKATPYDVSYREGSVK